MTYLKNKKILLGVSGSVAVHRSIDLTRRLTEAGASVHVIMTQNSQRFVTPLSFEVASGNKVHTDAFADPLSHISLPAGADLMLLAPATANIIGKFANGIADDMLSTCLLSFRGKTIIAPAMNWRMYENPIFMMNLERLLALGIVQIGPEKGVLACGEEALGKMSDVADIIEGVRTAFSKQDLAGKKILVTAGPTREYIDPVRFMSNRSSGKMGFAVARASSRRGAEVVLISGPSAQRPAPRVRLESVETAGEMRDAVFGNLNGCDIVIMTAAVADFTPLKRSRAKIEKRRGLTLELKATPDILSELGSAKKRPFLVGFAAETGDSTARARRKLAVKGADMIIFNDVTSPGSGFDVDTNRITVIDRCGETSFPLMTKGDAADALLDRIVHLTS